MATEATAQDPRDIVTPDAFTVAPELLGLPLAHPWRRLTAVLLDFCVVGVLSLSGSLAFALAFALLSHQLVSGWRGGESRRARQLALVVALAIGSGVFWLGEQIGDDEPEEASMSQDEALAEVAKTVETAQENPELAALELAITRLEKENRRLRAAGEQDEEEQSFSLVRYGEGLLEDIGFGFGWAAAYFALLTAWWKGQTLGKRVLGLRVLRLNGKPLSVWNSFERAGGYAAGLATGLLGFAQIHWDPNRQAIHDKICGTVVVDSRKIMTPL